MDYEVKRGRVREGNKGPIIQGVPEFPKLAVPDRRSGITADLIGHEVIVTGIVKDTNPDCENRGVLFVSCRHVPQECGACQRAIEEERRREAARRREQMRQAIIRQYGLWPLEGAYRDLPKAFALFERLETLHEPTIHDLEILAAKYEEWRKVRAKISRVESQLMELQYAPGAESLWKRYCELDHEERELFMAPRWRARDRVIHLQQEVKHFHRQDIVPGPSKEERLLREWRPHTGGLEYVQRLTWGTVEPREYGWDVYKTSAYECSPLDRSGWYWKTIETRPADPSWSAQKAAEYEETRRQLREAEEELARIEGDERLLKIKAETAEIGSKLHAAMEAYKASLLGDLPARSRQLWEELQALQERLPEA